MRVSSVTGAILLIAGVFSSTDVWPQLVSQDFWVPNGDVRTVVSNGGIVYLGGSFTRISPATGCALALDASTGQPRAPYPMIAGTANAVASDGNGGWYVGGSFTAVLGTPRGNLAHLDRDGNLTTWNPNPNGDPNDVVHAISVSGNTVYVAGSFSAIGGQPRGGIAAVDALSGAVTDWNPEAGAGIVALAASGGTVYVAGWFFSMGGQPRYLVAALDSATGAVTPWDPGNVGSPLPRNDNQRDPTLDRILKLDHASALTVRDGLVYIAGNFYYMGGQYRQHLAAVDAVTGVATDWDPRADDTVNALLVRGGTVYVGGEFYAIGDQPRIGIAAVDAVTGAVTDWNPNLAYSSVRAFAANGDTIYAGGWFDPIGGQTNAQLAAFDSQGTVIPMDPGLNGPVSAISVSEGILYVGGWFTGAGGVTRNRLAALDAATGMATDWNPDPDGDVYALAVHGNRVYAGGEFTRIGGRPRRRIAALDAGTGTAVPNWYSDVNGAVTALAISGGALYIGGYFTEVVGGPFNYLAALDTVTGWPLDWVPYANSNVLALAVSGGTVYAGGQFTTIGGAARNHIAALDATTGAATSWNPNVPEATAYVRGLVVRGETVYACGAFTMIGGELRNNIAALDATTGMATSWNPYANTLVTSLAVSSGIVYAGGTFTEMGGLPRNRLAAIDAATGLPTEWSADATGTIWAIGVHEGSVLFGGSFRSVDGLPHSYFASLSRGITAIEEGSSTAGIRLAAFPNPFPRVVTLRLDQPGTEDGSVVVFDIAGRLVRRLHRGALTPGVHHFSWDGRDDAGREVDAGVYLARVQSKQLNVGTRIVRIR